MAMLPTGNNYTHHILTTSMSTADAAVFLSNWIKSWEIRSSALTWDRVGCDSLDCHSSVQEKAGDIKCLAWIPKVY